MSRPNSIFICQQCAYQSPTFLGKCPECGTWNSLLEQITQTQFKTTSIYIKNISVPVNTSDIEKKYFVRISTRIEEFDRVLGGGVVLGSMVLVAGDPGIGKSTLLSQLAINLNSEKLRTTQKTSESDNQTTRNSGSPSHSDSFRNVLYVAGEESAHQIKLRIERIDPKANLLVLNETNVDAIVASIEQYKPGLVIVDSIQTLETEDLTAAQGSVSQVRESAHRLQKVSKVLHIPIFIVGHVTKEGSVAGPRTLEHIVDIVLSLEGDPANDFRILRATKNRFGPTDEVAVFEMEEQGMREVKNPSKLFLEEKVNAPGSAVTAILTGLRPILLEIQALVTKTNSLIPRRVGTGIDNNRLQLIVAVLQKRLKLPLWDQDVFVNVTGGIRINEPAADLAICMAIISSFKELNLPQKSVYIGEIGLLGELRSVRQLDKRISEARKLGFKEIISAEKLKNLNQVIQKLN